MPPAIDQRDARPGRGDELELRDRERSPRAAPASRGSDGFVVFVHGAVPGDRVRAEDHEVQARLRARPRRSSCSSRAPDRVDATTRAATAPGRPGRRSATSASCAQKQRRSRGAARLGGFDGFEMEPFVPADEQLALPQQDGVLVRRPDADGRLVLRLPPRGPLERIDDVRDDVLASERVDAVRNLGPRLVPRARASTAYDRRDARAASCATSWCARDGARGDLQVRIVTQRGRLRAPTSWPRRCRRDRRALDAQPSGVAETTRERRDRGDRRHREDRGGARAGGCASASRPTPSSRPTPRWPSASTALAAEYAALSGSERVFDLFCGIGTLSLALALRAGEVWGVDIVEQAIADAIENAALNEIDNAQLLRRRRAHRDPPAGGDRPPRPDVVVVDPPRAGLSKKVVRRMLELRRSASSTSPATRPRSRRMRASSSTPATGSLRCAAGRHVPAHAAHRVRRGTPKGLIRSSIKR